MQDDLTGAAPWIVFDASVNTFNHIAAIRALSPNGKVTVIRYLAAGLESAEKVIKQGEAHALAAAGIYLGLVYEISGQPSGATVGARDGAAAVTQAIAAGAPNDSSVILWYTVDWDAPESAMPGIIAAFRSFKAAVEPQFRVGAYASGAVCDELYDLKLIDARWITQSLGFRGSREAIAAGRYEMRQLLDRDSAGINVDPDVVRVQSNGAFVDIGDFVPFSQEAPSADPVHAPIDPAPSPAPADDTAAIVAIADASPIAHYQWRGQGVAPAGYVRGMALTFAQTYRQLKAGHPAAIEMAKANTHNDAHDAISWYNSNYAALGMNNDQAGADTLRHLFALMLGHGMRESSGKHCCGRDRSASNVSSDTAEAGLFQTSYNAHTCHPTFDPLMDEFVAGATAGFPEVFSHGVTCSPLDWANYGAGRGAQFQDLCKKQPAFSVQSAALVLRNLRMHYGPINRKEAELRPEADAMFRAVQDHVDSTWSQEGVI